MLSTILTKSEIHTITQSSMLSVLLGAFIVCSTTFLFKIWRLWFTTRISTATSLDHDLHVKSEIFVTCPVATSAFCLNSFCSWYSLFTSLSFAVTVQVRCLSQFTGKIHTGILCKMYTFVGSLVSSFGCNQYIWITMIVMIFVT